MCVSAGSGFEHEVVHGTAIYVRAGNEGEGWGRAALASEVPGGWVVCM